MLEKNIFEKTKLKLRAVISNSNVVSNAYFQDKEVSWVLDIDGKETSIPETVTPGQTILERFSEELPEVEDGKENYRVKCFLKVGDKKYEHPEQYIVWPQQCTIEVDDENNQKAHMFACEVRQGEHVLQVPLTNQQGLAVCNLKLPGPIDDVIPLAPWELVQPVQANGRKQKVKARKIPYKATFRSPSIPPSKEIKQYVNLPASKDNPFHGSTLAFVVGSIFDHAMENDPIYVEVEFGANNSARNDPRPALKVGGRVINPEPGNDKLFKQTLRLGPTKEAAFELELGYAGGDECTVKIGSTSACQDAQVKITNWRKLEYVMWQPAAQGGDKLTDYTYFIAADQAGLANGCTAYLKEVLDTVFVEFEPRTENGNNFIEKKDLLRKMKDVNVLDAGYFKKTAGDTVLCITFAQSAKLLKALAKKVQSKRTVTMIWVDYLSDLASWTGSVNVFKPTSYADGTDPGANPNDAFRYFKRAIDKLGSIQHGDYAIKKMQWRATHWWDPNRANSDGSVGGWVAITSKSDPGGNYRNWTTLKKEEIFEHFVLSDYATVDIRLPNNKRHYPGACFALDANGELCDDNGVGINIEFLFQGVRADMGYNGEAEKGDIRMNTFAGDATDEGMGIVILHELGHNMGQAYGGKATMPTYGRKDAHKIPGIDFPAAFPGSDYYDTTISGHYGPHCAHGLSGAEKNQAVTNDEFPASGDCIMFGSADMSANTKKYFCDNCKTYIKGTHLDDIRRAW